MTFSISFTFHLLGYFLYKDTKVTNINSAVTQHSSISNQTKNIQKQNSVQCCNKTGGQNINPQPRATK